MESILRDRSLSEIIPYDLSQPLLLFPVRHHSPVCAWQLVRTIRDYAPDIILIEGPENANDLIPVLTDEETRLPAALYCFYKDRNKLVSEEGKDYRCYYPFLEASPEYAAMAEGKKLGIPTRFMDLPYSEILIQTAGFRRACSKEEKQSYADDAYLVHSRFYEKLCEKTALRSFEEFWEKYFEIGGLRLSAGAFAAQMHAYCILTRQETPEKELEEDGCLVRERHMAVRIREAGAQYGKVLAVTGGFHSLGLWKLLQQGNPAPVPMHSFSDELQSCYPIAYSYEAADALSGYASGMLHPGFYDEICRKLMACDAPERIYSEQCLELLVRTAKESARRDIPVSIADVKAAYGLMEGLAALRGAKECGLFEVYDGVTGALIKGEMTLATSQPLDILGKLATGAAGGSIGDKSHVPPLIADFESQCSRFGLKSRTAVPQQSELSLFTSQKHMEMSRFFHRMEFLGTGFTRMLKGPDLHSGKDRSRVREIWKYCRTPQVDAVLIEHTTDGVTLEEACRTAAAVRLRENRSCERAAQIAVDCFLMDVTLASREERLMEEILAEDGDFFSLGQGLYYFDMLNELHELYGVEDDAMLRRISQCFSKLTALLPSMAGVAEEHGQACIRICRLLYGIAGRTLPERREELEQALLSMTRREKKEPSVYGAVMGLLYAMDSSRCRAAEEAMLGYLQGSLPLQKQGALYLKGLFATARDIALTDSRFLQMTDELIAHMEYEDFMEILPSLRLAFSDFTPAEIQTAAAAAAALHSSSGKAVLQEDAVDEALYAFGAALDRTICRQLGKETLQHG